MKYFLFLFLFIFGSNIAISQENIEVLPKLKKVYFAPDFSLSTTLNYRTAFLTVKLKANFDEINKKIDLYKSKYPDYEVRVQDWEPVADENGNRFFTLSLPGGNTYNLPFVNTSFESWNVFNTIKLKQEDVEIYKQQFLKGEKTLNVDSFYLNRTRSLESSIQINEQPCSSNKQDIGLSSVILKYAKIIEQYGQKFSNAEKNKVLKIFMISCVESEFYQNINSFEELLDTSKIKINLTKRKFSINNLEELKNTELHIPSINQSSKLYP